MQTRQDIVRASLEQECGPGGSPTFAQSFVNNTTRSTDRNPASSVSAPRAFITLVKDPSGMSVAEAIRVQALMSDSGPGEVHGDIEGECGTQPFLTGGNWSHDSQMCILKSAVCRHSYYRH
jgi:hypothetical protein